MGFFYFCTMVNEKLLSEIYENIVEKSYYQVQITHLEFYYKKVYGKELNKSCSSCLIDAHIMLKKYYKENIGKFDAENEYAKKQKAYELKKALFEFQKQDKFELCQWIKNRIND